VEESVLFHQVTIGRHARIRRAIIDKGVKVPAYTQIGFDLELDRQRFHVSPEGIVVVGKGTIIAPTPAPVLHERSEE
jgi:glucose-1-phosphate adenylyltransferase